MSSGHAVASARLALPNATWFTFRRAYASWLHDKGVPGELVRERKDDLLMLVEYFVQCYASQVGKDIRSIDKKTLDLGRQEQRPGSTFPPRHSSTRFDL